MLGAIRRWFRHWPRPEAECLEREAEQRQDLQRQVNDQLADLITYLDGLSAKRDDTSHEGRPTT